MSTSRMRTAVCAMAKDEDRYILQWAAYHLAIGFDHVVIYDNMSRRPVETFFSRRVLGKRVTVIRWPSRDDTDTQPAAYADFLVRFRGQFDWVAVIDLDELINLKHDASISSFLSRFPDAAAVSINWRIFGSAGQQAYDRRLMMERFPLAADLMFDPNRLVKTIYNLQHTRRIGIHSGDYADDAVVRSADGSPITEYPCLTQREANFQVAQINHYFVKSREEWAWKMKRGYACRTVRPEGTFEHYDRNEFEDLTISSVLDETKVILRGISSIRERLSSGAVARVFDRIAG